MKNHHFEPSILRAYDIRGEVDKTLSTNDALGLGLAFGTVVVRNGGHSVCVGYDGRLSSPDFEAALVEGLILAGITVYRIGCGPTPMLYFAVHHLEADGGIMVTGSHNPPEFNGFKMMLGKSGFFGDDIQMLGLLAKEGNFISGNGGEEKVDVKLAYVDRLLQKIDFPAAVKVAWDPGNGAAGSILPELVERLPGSHILINETVDGTFPNHHPDPTVVENLVQLKSVVLEQNCDLGVAFDGDGDRLGVLDARGRIVWGDQLIAILAKEVLSASPGATIIGDVKCSAILFEEIQRLNGQAIMWAAGHSLIKAKMLETAALLGGEMSGHIFFADKYYGFDDAIYAALRLLETVKHRDLSVAEMLDALPKMFNTPEIRFDCPENRKFAVVEEVRALLKAESADICEIDGVRVSTDDGWWLLRASNTQAVLTVRCEARDEKGLTSLKNHVIAYLKKSGISVSVPGKG